MIQSSSSSSDIAGPSAPGQYAESWVDAAEEEYTR